MAIALATTNRVDFTAMYTSAITTNITLAVTLKLNANANIGERIVTKWGADGFFEMSMVLYCGGSSQELGWGVKQSAGGPLNLRKTTTGVLVSGAFLRIVARFVNSTNPDIWLNGVQQTTYDAFNNGNPNNVSASPVTFQAGFETNESINAVSADYSELAFWVESVPDWVCAGYGKGMSPLFYKTASSYLYCPMTNVSDLLNRWQSPTAYTGNGTNYSGTNAAHPSMYNPS